MLLAHPAIRPGIVLILALRTAGRLGIQVHMIGIHIRIALHALRMKRSVENTPIRCETGVVQSNADVGIRPGQPVVSLLGTTVLARLVVLLTASADGQDSTGEGNVDGIAQAGRGEPENGRPLWGAVRHVVRIHCNSDFERVSTGTLVVGGL